jgi:hypothetical protein
MLEFTWIFQGHTSEVSPDFVDALDIDPTIEVGFIKLTGTGRKLEINLVQKPRVLIKGVRFCSEILPATVEAFYEHSGLDLKNLRFIEVVNVSNDRLRSCKCYLRLMLAMRFTQINRTNVEFDKIEEFCKQMGGATLIEGVASEEPALPLVSDEARDALAQNAFRDEVIWIARGTE